MNKYTPVIGLEVHTDLATESKMFCGCPASHFGKKPNTQTCPVCLGLPGALPVPNKKAIEWCVLLGLALECKINKKSSFDRKHYFYPDLPKGYQISQYEDPFCFDGKFIFSSGKKIGITRIHMEEDTAKLQHTEIKGEKVSLVDFNRSGVPLVELVTEPDFDKPEDVSDFLQELQRIVRHLGISEADMEKGSMRLEANVSLKESNGSNLPNYKVELKNINSFRFLKKAIEFELKRQAEILAKGEEVIQETRGWNEAKGETVSQRTKEAAKDYRYFPDPDIPPIELGSDWISEIEKKLTELPEQKRKTLEANFGLPKAYTEILIKNPNRLRYFEKAVEIGKENAVQPKNIANAIINKNFDREYKDPGDLIKRLKEETSVSYASESEVLSAVSDVLEKESKAVASYKSGRVGILGYLIGQVQKKLEGKGDPRFISSALLDKLS